MNLDLHVWRFDWAGTPAQMGGEVAALAQRAEALGVRTLSFMDHYFQMEAMAPATDPMLEGYTHKLDVLRRHCDDVGRDPNEIEVTAMFRDLPPDITTAQVLAGAQALAAVGVSSLVTSTVGDDPAGWLESTFTDAIDDLAAIEPARL